MTWNGRKFLHVSWQLWGGGGVLHIAHSVSKVSTTGRGTSALSTYLCIALYLCPSPPPLIKSFCTYNYISFHVSNAFPFSMYCTFKKFVKKGTLNPVRVCPTQLLLVFYLFFILTLSNARAGGVFLDSCCVHNMCLHKIS